MTIKHMPNVFCAGDTYERRRRVKPTCAPEYRRCQTAEDARKTAERYAAEQAELWG